RIFGAQRAPSLRLGVPEGMLRPPLLAYASIHTRAPLLGPSTGVPITKAWEGPLDHRISRPAHQPSL
ncbi:MAG TPA: hypothetical protein VIP78_00955, partial [Candidatus Dormibacteraeota bacterium]